MKKLITLCLLFIITLSYSQSIFLEFRLDPKMAIEGPYEDGRYGLDHGTFNPEFLVGFEWEKQRIGFSLETHDAIAYQKIAIFYDHKFNITNNGRVQLYIGPELSAIRRTDVFFTSDHREKTTTLPNYGFNTGMYYNIKWKGNNTGFQIGINWNIFRGETEYKMYKKTYFDEFRNDFMICIKRNF